MPKKKSEQNYLDLVPAHNPANSFVEEDGIVKLIVTRRGLYDRMAQKFFHAPASTDIALDIYGSYIWTLINGKRTVYGISQHIKEHFGNDAEPLLDRLVKFFAILKNNELIVWIGGPK